ncbi:N-acetyltransferase [Galactobacter valiniphilus]|uniref:N-acetyltransferase n=1 Tax=Galactobacter valiniphilus TaxID=2676122 RepID=A0A399JFS5_9MICC|nr:GNAT family protein [Galactobacter valiniphilus]RII43457.1 N-acetyltransferase [Galactobacter valiniphilus]
MSTPPRDPRPVLSGERVTLSPLRGSDKRAFKALVARNRDWLAPFGASDPHAAPAAGSFSGALREAKRAAKQGRSWGWALRLGARAAAPQAPAAVLGQVSLHSLTGGAARQGSIGYWIDRGFSGRGLASEAVSVVLDHGFGEAGLHRVEALVHPENAPSLALLRRLGFREEGVRERALWVRGNWCDHLVLALTEEEWPPGGRNSLA